MAAAVASATEYERLRLERIAKNRELLGNLNVKQLTVELKQAARAEGIGGPDLSKQKPRQFSGQRAERGPKRISSRLAGKPSIHYGPEVLDQAESKKGGRTSSRHMAVPAVRREELYDSEDDKKLGSYQEPWQLFVDGVGPDGKRVYDRENGKTCHQCRQKTMGMRTSCQGCQSLRGQFCGDCLFMRYGENVRETLQNQNWVCPVCRDICNCSFCRLKKGWSPTGLMYREALSSGHISVAHYLMATRRKTKEGEEKMGIEGPGTEGKAGRKEEGVGEVAEEQGAKGKGNTGGKEDGLEDGEATVRRGKTKGEVKRAAEERKAGSKDEPARQKRVRLGEDVVVVEEGEREKEKGGKEKEVKGKKGKKGKGEKKEKGDMDEELVPETGECVEDASTDDVIVASQEYNLRPRRTPKAGIKSLAGLLEKQHKIEKLQKLEKQQRVEKKQKNQKATRASQRINTSTSGRGAVQKPEIHDSSDGSDIEEVFCTPVA